MRNINGLTLNLYFVAMKISIEFDMAATTTLKLVERLSIEGSVIIRVTLQRAIWFQFHARAAEKTKNIEFIY
jgi:hypothetical protein